MGTSPASQSAVIVTPEWPLWARRMCDRRYSSNSRARTRVWAVRHHTAMRRVCARLDARGYAAGNAQAGSKWAAGLIEVRPYLPGVAVAGQALALGAGGTHEVLDRFRAPADARLVG